MKKFLSFVLTVVLLSTLCVAIPNTNLTVFSFDNIPADAIHIKTAAELAAIGGDQSKDKHYVLENDIMLKDEWVPINDFQGTFDGRGHTISNLYVVIKSNRQYAGLFGNANSATIENVGVNIASQGISSNSDRSYAGGLIGLSINSTIINCYTTGSVSSSSNSDAYAGGLIGNANGSTISNCYATGNITASGAYKSSYVGGLIGLNNSSTIENSYRLSTQKIKGSKTDDSGQSLTDAQMRTPDSFKEWDFGGVWTHKKGINKNYPVFISANSSYRELEELENAEDIFKEMAEEITGYTVLLLDLSHSMGGEAGRVLKDCAKIFCETNLKKEENQIAIVTYASDIKGGTKNPYFESNTDILKNFIDNVKPLVSKTNLGAAVDKAKELLKNIPNDLNKNIFIMSDGKPNRGKNGSSYHYSPNDYPDSEKANYVYEQVQDFKKPENCYVWAVGLYHNFSKATKANPSMFPRRFLQELADKDKYNELY